MYHIIEAVACTFMVQGMPSRQTNHNSPLYPSPLWKVFLYKLDLTVDLNSRLGLC